VARRVRLQLPAVLSSIATQVHYRPTCLLQFTGILALGVGDTLVRLSNMGDMLSD